LTGGAPSPDVPLWRRAWPATVALGLVALVFLGKIVAQLVPAWRGTRTPDVIALGGLWALVLLGLPLLLAWALWSVLRVRHWAGRLAVYVVIVLIIVALCLWFVFAHPPQM
jgi:cobalamin biosynthesis protein CobD/CbiB